MGDFRGSRNVSTRSKIAPRRVSRFNAREKNKDLTERKETMSIRERMHSRIRLHSSRDIFRMHVKIVRMRGRTRTWRSTILGVDNGRTAARNGWEGYEMCN